jgi:hypothetical protein
MSNEVDNGRMPTSDLDLNLMITNNQWGSKEVSEELKDTLSKYYEVPVDTGMKDENGKAIIEMQKFKESMWGILDFYTRDIRLGNLSVWDGELKDTRWNLDLAGHFIQLEIPLTQPFLVSLRKAITIIETSQSKGGFLRTKMNTLRHESLNQNIEAPKKSFFGGKGNNQEV